MEMSMVRWMIFLKEFILKYQVHVWSRSFFAERVILTPRNEDVDLINSKLIERSCGNAYFYKSSNTVIDDHCNIYPTEFLNTLCQGGMSPRELVSKLNNPVILLRKLDPSIGLCNGTRLIYRKFMPNLIQCEISTRFSKGDFIYYLELRLGHQMQQAIHSNSKECNFPLSVLCHDSQ